MEHARLFLALDVDAAVRTRLMRAMQALQEVMPRARWCREDALHLTVWFFGTLPLAAVNEIAAAVGPVAQGTPEFACCLRGIGGFPALERPRVVWAGVGEGSEHVCGLAAQVREALELQGFGGEERAYVPHVTLARMTVRAALDAAVLERALPGVSSYEFGRSEIDKLVLYASERGPGGPVYSVVDSWDLAGAG